MRLTLGLGTIDTFCTWIWKLYNPWVYQLTREFSICFTGWVGLGKGGSIRGSGWERESHFIERVRLGMGNSRPVHCPTHDEDEDVLLLGRGRGRAFGGGSLLCSDQILLV